MENRKLGHIGKLDHIGNLGHIRKLKHTGDLEQIRKFEHIWTMGSLANHCEALTHKKS